MRKKLFLTKTKMDKYRIDYENSDGDMCHAWCMASSIGDAEQTALNSYWDIDRILLIAKADRNEQ